MMMVCMNRESSVSQVTKTKTLADVLAEKRIVPAERLAQAREYQDSHAVTLDQALVALRMLTEEDLQAVYGDVFDIRPVKLEDLEIDREAVKHVPGSVAHRHRLIPFRRSGNILAVAMADPTDPAATDALKSVTDFEIIPFAARPEAVEHAVYLHYGEALDAPSGEAGRLEHSIMQRLRGLIEDDGAGHAGRSIPLIKSWSFESFLEDSANRMALGAARAIAESATDQSGSFLHIWGTSGCGKSHLLHAVAGRVVSRAPLKRLLLTTGPRFAAYLFETIRDDKLNLFRYLHRELDLLLIDDADCLLERPWAQSELAETWKHLRTRNGAFILAGRANWAAEPALLPELRSILGASTVVGFSRYTESAKHQLVSQWSRSVALPPEVAAALVAYGGDDLHRLYDAVQQAVVAAIQGEEPLTLETLNDVLQLGAAPRVEAPLPDFELRPLSA